MNAVARLTDRASSLTRWLAAIPLRIERARRDREAAAAASSPSVKERQTDLIHFYAHYESLVEALCDAAQYGPADGLERSYQLARQWMLVHYPKQRQFLLAFLRLEPEDAKECAQLDGTHGDAFEALFAAPSLNAFLEADDGNMIARIMRTREALSLYGEHLRQLLARDRTCM